MAAFRLLPFELQTILSAPLRRSPPLLTPLQARRHIAVGIDLFARPVSSVSLSGTDAFDGPAPRDLFEDLSPEYSVPESILKRHLSPRDPSLEIERLLKKEQFDDADALLHQYQSANVHLTSRRSFLDRSVTLFRKDRYSAWLPWFDAAIPPGDLLHEDEVTVSGARWASIVCEELLSEPHDLALMRDFLLVAVGKGFDHVAKSILLNFAVYASLEESEHLWEAVMHTVNTRRWTTQTGRLGGARATGEGSQDEATRKTRWQVYRRTRNRILRTHISLERLEEALQVAVAMEAPCDVSVRSWGALLSAAALGDRYDVFKAAYHRVLDSGRGFRFVGHLDGSSKPYQIVPAGRDLGDHPSPQEVFVGYRYGNFSSPMEEGAEVARNQRHDVAGNDRLSKAVEERDLASSCEIFLDCFKHDRLPSLDAAARFIHLAKNSGHTNIIDGISRSTSARNLWFAGYWATANMLDHLRSREYDAALRVFAGTFQVAALPPLFRTTITRILNTGPPVDSSPRNSPPPLRRTLLDAHTFAIATQALLGYLLRHDEVHSESQCFELIDQLYQTLLQAARSKQLPLLRLDRGTVLEFDAPPPTTPLDPHTFIPFLKAFSRNPSYRPITVLSVLRDMAHLNLPTSKFHWHIVSGAFAYKGQVSDFLFLLDILEGRSPSADPSNELAEILQEIPLPPAKGQDIVAYTSMIAGLGRKHEFEMAWTLSERVAESEELAGAVDETFRRTIEELRASQARERAKGASVAGAGPRGAVVGARMRA
ncbi:hypothetical protein MNV49_004761 [Pseudohyphozyma bogoriensis]|nr:hypothetical protein MNV49_004761 [Pseudohyphozyma bogoriensis]